MTANAQTITTCSAGQAPPAYAPSTCSIGGGSPCSLTSNGLVCDFNAVSCDPGRRRNMYAVNYGGGGISAFGSCFVNNTQRFYCCRINDTTGLITKVNLKGSSDIEEPIGFSYNSWDLEPTSASSKMTATAYGRQGDDIIIGSNSISRSYGETLYGNLGSDILYGNNGDDRLEGGNGSDTLYGGEGEDILLGQNGSDTLYGGDHNDQLHGGDGADTLEGEAGDDDLYGGTGNDELLGGDDDDVLCDSSVYPGPGQCQSYYLSGGNGHDRLHIPWVAICAPAAIPLGLLAGDESIEQARHGAWPFDSPPANIRDATLGITEEFTNTPYPECSALTTLGGF